jgi:hypothetical protein
MKIDEETVRRELNDMGRMLIDTSLCANWWEYWSQVNGRWDRLRAMLEEYRRDERAQKRIDMLCAAIRECRPI